MIDIEKEMAALHAVVLQGAKANLLRDSQLMPTFFIVSETREIEIIGVPGNLDDQRVKNELARFMRERARNVDAKLIAFVFDGWTVTSKTPPTGPIRNDPRRREALFAVIEARGFKRKMWMAPYDRDEEGKVTNIEQWDEQDGEASGRFIGLLPELN